MSVPTRTPEHTVLQAMIIVPKDPTEEIVCHWHHYGEFDDVKAAMIRLRDYIDDHIESGKKCPANRERSTT